MAILIWFMLAVVLAAVCFVSYVTWWLSGSVLATVGMAIIAAAIGIYWLRHG